MFNFEIPPRLQRGTGRPSPEVQGYASVFGGHPRTFGMASLRILERQMMGCGLLRRLESSPWRELPNS
jgi:hypothetical protein